MDETIEKNGVRRGRTIGQFGKWVKFYLVEHNLRLKDIAEKLGVSLAYLSKFGGDSSFVPLKFMSKLVQTLELSAEEKQSLKDIYQGVVLQNCKNSKQIRLNIAELPEQVQELATVFVSSLLFLSNEEATDLLARLKNGSSKTAV
jgi:hypothetical protein